MKDIYISLDFTIASIDFDVVSKTFCFEQPKVDLIYKPSSRWFMPEYHIKNATIRQMNFDGSVAQSSWDAESVEKVFAKWYHKPVFWLWSIWQKGIRKWRFTQQKMI